MTKEEYQTAKSDILAKYGKPEYDYDRKPLNQAAVEMTKIKMELLQTARIAKRTERLEQKAVQQTETAVLADIVPKSSLGSLVVLEKDLRGFTALEGEIIRAYFANRNLSPQQLGRQFNKSHQFVGGLLRRPEFKLLRLKYFNEELSSMTQNAVLDAIKRGNPNIIQAAVEYTGLMKANETKQELNRLNNTEHNKYLQLLANWLVSDEQTLTLTKDVGANGVDNSPTPHQ